MRQDVAKPLLDEFHGWLQKTAPRVAPKSLVGEVVNFASNQWPIRVTRHLHKSDGRPLPLVGVDQIDLGQSPPALSR